jgi:hypothetical protein
MVLFPEDESYCFIGIEKIGKSVPSPARFRCSGFGISEKAVLQ